MVQMVLRHHLLPKPGGALANAASRLVAVIKLRTCHIYLFSSPPTPRLPHTHPSLSLARLPPFGPLTVPDGQVGRLWQVPIANSPSPVALRPLCGEKGDAHHGSRYPKPLLNNSSSSAAPHLSLPSTISARRRSITVSRARPKRPSTTKGFFPRSEKALSVAVYAMK